MVYGRSYPAPLSNVDSIVAHFPADFKHFSHFSAAPHDPAAAPAGQEIAAVDDQQQNRRHGAGGRRVHLPDLGDHRVGRRHAHGGVDQRQGQGQEKGEEYLDIHRPGPHPLRRAQPGQELVAGALSAAWVSC